MTRLQHFDEVYSVLFVDFDNIYKHLKEQNPQVAYIFATNPQQWLRWLEGHAIRMIYGDGIRRRILKRCCYINLLKHHEFRPFFSKAAFQIVDCHPASHSHKTNADVQLVMDCMDALAHPTRFDEFIILSGNADFTPLLFRIQEHARKSIIFSVGYTSPDYVAACSWRIREDWFITQALEGSRTDESDTIVAPEPKEQRRPDSKHEGSGKTAASPKRTLEPFKSKKNTLQLVAGQRAQLIESIKTIVASSSAPTPLPAIAQELHQQQNITPDWFGAGTLRELLCTLDLSPLLFSATEPGYVYNPEHHNPPEYSYVSEDFRKKMPKLYDFASNVHKLTAIPLLSPALYGRLLHLLAEEIEINGYARSKTIKTLERQCTTEDIPVTAKEIGFIIDSIIEGGCSLSDTESYVSQEAMQEALIQKAIELCRLASMDIKKKEQQYMKEWLGQI